MEKSIFRNSIRFTKAEILNNSEGFNNNVKKGTTDDIVITSKKALNIIKIKSINKEFFRCLGMKPNSLNIKLIVFSSLLKNNFY